MDLESLSFLTELNGLEVLGIIVVYLIISGVGKKLWIKNKKKDPINHEACPLYPDFQLTVKLAIEKAIKIFDIQKYETIKRQMNKVEQALNNIIDIHNQNYKKLIIELYESDGDFEKDELHYNLLIESVINNMKGRIRSRIIENHLLKKTDVDYRLYIEHANKNLVQLVTGNLDVYYKNRYFKISREKLHEYNKSKLIEEIYPILTSMWWSVRAIVEEMEEEVKKLEEE